MDWDLGKEICGMVYDTTSSTTGAEIVACRCPEIWLNTPILWLGCRHHIGDLHVQRVIKELTGQTKDPGVCHVC